MPHKHKRKHNAHDRANDDDNPDFNLPPDKRARPLVVGPSAVKNKYDKEPFEGFGDGPVSATGETARAGTPKEKKDNKRRKPQDSSSKKGSGKVKDDTPKQFARMMAWQQAKLAEKQKDKEKEKEKADKTAAELVPAPSKSKTKPKPATTSTETGTETGTGAESNLKIKPGESLSAFAQRVNRSLPLSGIPKSGANPNASGGIPVAAADGKDQDGKERKNKKKMDLSVPKDPLTRHNKHLQRMQSEWRNAENKINEQRAEEDEEREELREEHALLWMDVDAARTNKKGRKKKKGGREDEDPWKVLLHKKKREEQLQLLQNEAATTTNNAPLAVIPSVAGLTASKSVQAPLAQSAVRKLDIERVKRMFRVQ